MGIDWTQVEAIVREDPKGRIAGSRVECPSPEDLVRFVEGKSGRKARARTMQHLASCIDCARIIQSLLRLSQEVDKLTGKSGEGQSCPPILPHDKKDSFRPSVGRRLALAGLASLIGVAAISVLLNRIFERPVVRGGDGSDIKLIYPKRGEAVTARNLKFRWEAVPQTSHYYVDLFGRSLEKISSSEPVSEPSYELTAEAFRALKSGEVFYWRVRAVLKEGREAVSRLSEFSIRE